MIHLHRVNYMRGGAFYNNNKEEEKGTNGITKTIIIGLMSYHAGSMNN